MRYIVLYEDKELDTAWSIFATKESAEKAKEIARRIKYVKVIAGPIELPDEVEFEKCN